MGSVILVENLISISPLVAPLAVALEFCRQRPDMNSESSKSYRTFALGCCMINHLLMSFDSLIRLNLLTTLSVGSRVAKKHEVKPADTTADPMQLAIKAPGE